MKKYILSLAPLLLVVCGAPLASAQDKVSIEEHVKADIAKRTSINASPIQDVGILTCFAFEAYDVEIKTKQHDHSYVTTNEVHIKTNTGMQKIPYRRPGEDVEIPEMLPLIKPGFKLMTQADGVAMLSALKALYKRTRSSFSDDDDKEPEFVQKGTTWYFIMDQSYFSGKLDGFVFVTDSVGKITKVSYSLNIKK